MSRHLTGSRIAIALLFVGFAAQATAQGVLVDVRAETQVRLPRPIPFPRPVPGLPNSAPPTASYKIDALDVNARITDQIARVQVAQTQAGRDFAWDDVVRAGEGLNLADGADLPLVIERAAAAAGGGPAAAARH